MANDAAGQTVLYTTTGVQTAAFPQDNPYQVLSPLGDRLLAAHITAGLTDSLYAISAGGALEQLVRFANPADFVDAIGSRDGRAWAWMLHGTVSGCVAAPAGATTDVYVASSPGTGVPVIHLSPLPGAAQWSFYQWTAAGIVLREGNPPGCYEGPRYNDKATQLLNPATGDLVPLGARMGDGCLLQDIADDGAILCMPASVLGSGHTFSPATTLLRTVAPDGSHRDIPAADFIKTCAAPAAFGDVSISGDAQDAAVTAWCGDVTASHPRISTWIVLLRSLLVLRAPMAGLDAVSWLPGRPTLIASAYAAGVPVPGTFAVAVDGTATRLMSNGAVQQCLAHY